MSDPCEIGGIDPAGVGDQGASQRTQTRFELILLGRQLGGYEHGSMVIRQGKLDHGVGISVWGEFEVRRARTPVASPD